jgi:hypothetical protein
LALTPDEALFSVRGFHDGAPAARRVLERHGASFIAGFNAALSARDTDDLGDRLALTPVAERGFAYEGAAMASALLDRVSLGSGSRLERLLAGPGRPHVYIVHVGAGWALARLRVLSHTCPRALDPLLRWLAFDGYGFHQGFFHPEPFVGDKATDGRLSGYELRAFDQGLGRSLWFVHCADVERVADTIAAFPPHRRGDLWSGLGLAATYTTAAGAAELVRLRELAGDARPHVAQGAAFAAVTRHRAGNVVAHTQVAAELLCGRGVAQVAEMVKQAGVGLCADPDGRGYEQWRTRLRERLSP